MPAPYPDELKARALELLADGTAIAATRKALRAEFGRAPAASTLKAWASDAGVDRSVRPRKGAESGAATPEQATAARLERMALERAELSELILSKLGRGSAELLVKRLQRALEAEQLVDLAAERWADALKFERIVAEEHGGPDELKAAKLRTAEASDDLAVAHRLAIGTRDLVGILTRAVTDHLALAGIELEGRETGELIVELLIPEPQEPAEVHAEAELERQDT